jgi:hypothetical protein
MLTKICQYCKKPLKKGQQKYCSIECMARAFTGRKMDKTTRGYIKREITKNCQKKADSSL